MSRLLTLPLVLIACVACGRTEPVTDDGSGGYRMRFHEGVHLSSDDLETRASRSAQEFCIRRRSTMSVTSIAPASGAVDIAFRCN